MRRLLLLSLVCGSWLACDPKLEIQSAPGDGGAEGGPTPTNPAPPAPPGGDDAGDASMGDDGGTEGGTGHPFTGSASDFASGEKFVTTSPGPPDTYNGYVAWDAKNVYFGMQGKDVGSGLGDRWVLLYVGVPGVAGTTTGIAYNCGGACNTPAQQATLPFPASHHIRWKVDNSYSNVQKSSGGAWTDETLLPPLVIKRSGTFVELAVSRAALGSPSKLDVHMTMLIEEPSGGANGGWTYSGVPSTSFTDGYNPSYAHYYEFDLTDLATPPTMYTPKP
jgi:hypothetical protein